MSGRGEKLSVVEAHAVGKAAGREYSILEPHALAGKVSQPRVLLEGHMTLGAVTAVGGDSGAGKTLVLGSLLGRVQRGVRLPGEAQPFEGRRGVLWYGCDDPISDIRRRLRNVGMVDELTTILHKPLEIRKLAVGRELRKLIRTHDIGFVVLETPEMLLPERADTNSNSDVRRYVMVPVRDLAEEEQVTPFMIRHLSKPPAKGGVDPLHRFSGATQWNAGCRAKMAVGLVDGERSESGRPIRFIGALALHDGEVEPAWLFEIVGEFGKGRATNFRQDGRTAKDILTGRSEDTGPTKAQQVSEFLAELLETEPDIRAREAQTRAYAEFPRTGHTTMSRAWNLALMAKAPERLKGDEA